MGKTKARRIAARPRNAPIIHAEHFLDDNKERDLRNFFCSTIEMKDKQIEELKETSATCQANLAIAQREIERLTKPPFPSLPSATMRDEARIPTPDDIEAALRRQPAQECPSAKEDPVDDEAAMEVHRQANQSPATSATGYDVEARWEAFKTSPERIIPTDETAKPLQREMVSDPPPDCKIVCHDAGSPGRPVFAMPTDGQLDAIFKRYRDTKPKVPVAGASNTSPTTSPKGCYSGRVSSSSWAAS
jgi:hypothetical protein